MLRCQSSCTICAVCSTWASLSYCTPAASSENMLSASPVTSRSVCFGSKLGHVGGAEVSTFFAPPFQAEPTSLCINTIERAIAWSAAV